MRQIGTKMGPNWDHVGAKMIAIGTKTGPNGTKMGRKRL